MRIWSCSANRIEPGQTARTCRLTWVYTSGKDKITVSSSRIRVNITKSKMQLSTKCSLICRKKTFLSLKHLKCRCMLIKRFLFSPCFFFSVSFNSKLYVPIQYDHFCYFFYSFLTIVTTVRWWNCECRKEKATARLWNPWRHIITFSLSYHRIIIIISLL